MYPPLAPRLDDAPVSKVMASLARTKAQRPPPLTCTLPEMYPPQTSLLHSLKKIPSLVLRR